MLQVSYSHLHLVLISISLQGHPSIAGDLDVTIQSRGGLRLLDLYPTLNLTLSEPYNLTETCLDATNKQDALISYIVIKSATETTRYTSRENCATSIEGDVNGTVYTRFKLSVTGRNYVNLEIRCPQQYIISLNGAPTVDGIIRWESEATNLSNLKYYIRYESNGEPVEQIWENSWNGNIGCQAEPTTTTTISTTTTTGLAVDTNQQLTTVEIAGIICAVVIIILVAVVLMVVLYMKRKRVITNVPNPSVREEPIRLSSNHQYDSIVDPPELHSADIMINKYENVNNSHHNEIQVASNPYENVNETLSDRTDERRGQYEDLNETYLNEHLYNKLPK